LDEKRSFPRTICNEMIKYTNGKKGQARDISLSGIRFRTSEIFKQGTMLDLNFCLLNKGIIRSRGLVVWSLLLNDCIYENGLHFNSINAEGKTIISDYINQRLNLGEERRQAQRFLIDVCINYSVNAKARTRNITEAGMSLFTEHPIAEKQIIFLSIPLPAGDAISLHGKAIWNKQVKKDLFENGIVFWNIDEIEKRKLVSLSAQNL